MQQLQSFTGANDNSPTWVMDKAAPRKQTSLQPVGIYSKPVPKKKTSFNLLWVLPFAALSAGLWAWLNMIPTGQILWPAAAIGMMLLLSAAAAKSSYQNRDLCVLTATGAFATSLFAATTQTGVALFPTDIAVMVATLSLGLSWVFKSRPALLLSGFSGLVWLASLQPTVSEYLGLGVPATQAWLPLFPILILAQAILAKYLRTYAPMVVTIMAAYGIAAIVGTTFPSLALAGVLFAAAAAHHRLGKAWADMGTFAARLHITTGWLVAIGAATVIQSHWLNEEAGQAAPLWLPTEGWWIALVVSGFGLFISSILRYKHAQITLSGIFLVSAAASILPIASLRPDLIYYAFDLLPGLPARPGFGFIIGAAIMASSIGWIVNGLRTGKLLDILLGSAVVAIQVMILFTPGEITLDFGIVFVLAFICALCVSGLIAGSSLSHSRPARRYANSLS